MMSKNKNTNRSVAIIGGGLVGALQACFLAEKGFNVQLFEMRQDIRGSEKVFGRSINLAISCRGREALRAVGLEDKVINNGIPLYGRMIHDLKGRRCPIAYGKSDQFIMSVDRRCLNEMLLTAAEGYPNVRINFDHKLTSCDFEKGEHTFKRTVVESLVVEKTDLIIGCDGAFSATRNQIMKTTRMKYSQEFITEGYIELRIPPTVGNQFAMEKNFLHIWPRNTFMMIALPNVEDNSFVATLFLAFDKFESLKTEQMVIEFFQEMFPDALNLIGRETVIEAFFNLTPLPLISVKCSPYHVSNKAVILGDAAHAMVPFYGQGLNCGFEDLLVFRDLMNKYNDDFEKVLPEFTRFRAVDAQSMNDLAMFNYNEMRAAVNSRWFFIRKKLDNFLFWLLPGTWIPLYTMVSFTRTRYHECVARRRWQDKVLHRAVLMTVGAMTFLLSVAAYKSISISNGKQHLTSFWNLLLENIDALH